METDATTAVTPQSWGQIKDGARIEETRHGWSAGATELASRMTPLIILGSGPHAREMADIVAQINRHVPTWDLLGYLVPVSQSDQRGKPLIGDHCCLGTYDALDEFADARLAWSFGCLSPTFPRERVINLVSPSAFVASTAQLGTGCVIYPGCFVGHDAEIGDRLFALPGATINHDDVLGDDVTMASSATLAGQVTVGDGCYLGQSCTVRQELRIGPGAMIGMGAVVISDVSPKSVMVGNPARHLRDRDDGGGCNWPNAPTC